MIEPQIAVPETSKVISKSQAEELVQPYKYMVDTILPLFISRCAAIGYSVRRQYTLREPEYEGGPLEYSEQVQGGNEVVISSFYRSSKLQAELFEKYSRDPGHNFPANKPGNSFHEYGAAFDFYPVINKQAILGYSTPAEIAQWVTIGQVAMGCGMNWYGYKLINKVGLTAAELATSETDSKIDVVHCQLRKVSLTDLKQGLLLAASKGPSSIQVAVSSTASTYAAKTKGCTSA